MVGLSVTVREEKGSTYLRIPRRQVLNPSWICMEEMEENDCFLTRYLYLCALATPTPVVGKVNRYKELYTLQPGDWLGPVRCLLAMLQLPSKWGLIKQLTKLRDLGCIDYYIRGQLLRYHIMDYEQNNRLSALSYHVAPCHQQHGFFFLPQTDITSLFSMQKNDFLPIRELFCQSDMIAWKLFRTANDLAGKVPNPKAQFGLPSKCGISETDLEMIMYRIALDLDSNQICCAKCPYAQFTVTAVPGRPGFFILEVGCGEVADAYFFSLHIAEVEQLEEGRGHNG